MSILLGFPSCLMLMALAATPSPVSTRACPREPALEPSRGISLRAWKFRGLRPRTTIGAVMDSDTTTLELSERVPKTFKCSTKCCWSSFLRPLLAVALQNAASAPEGITAKSSPQGHVKEKKKERGEGKDPHSKLKTAPADGVDGKLSICIGPVLLERN